MIRDIGASILQTLGYEVKTISDGLETVLTYQIAQRSGVPFDAVILDLTVAGGMGGKETLRRLLEIDPGAKVIVSSGYSSDPVMAQSDAHGFNAVVVKPYTIQELERTLNRILYR